MDRPVTALVDWLAGLGSLGLPEATPVIAHASLSAFGTVDGGEQTVVEALLRTFETVIMPGFTYATMVTPEVGPPDNGLAYGTRQYSNYQARFFTPDLPTDGLMGRVPEALRLRPGAGRSCHPILSFVGMHAGPILGVQTLAEPLAPIGALVQSGGWVLLLGVNHTVNTSVHYAERLAGRPAFVRWALTHQGVVECPHFPGCSDGFAALAPRLASATRRTAIGRGLVQAVPLAAVMRAVQDCLAQDPLALLCNRYYCERCHDFRLRMAHSDSHNSSSISV
jgi:aminoglycoside 3-N-acetyltransferase